MVKMKRVITALKRSGSSDKVAAAARGDPASTSGPTGGPATAGPASAAYAVDDTPEQNIRRAITNFCESGGDSGPQAGDEVLYLPPIVDAAECSPTAAKEAAVIIRKFLDMKRASKPYVQYNAIMIMRILADNPGKTFTRNLDAKFADKVKELLKNGRDQSVRQLLAETLEHFEVAKKEDEGLALLREVWAKQKAILARYQQPVMVYQPVLVPPAQYLNNHSPRHPGGSSLPPLEELAGRISEAQTSAKLLHQVLASTPRNEVLRNDLVKEFAHRCKSASRSMQDLITCDNPPPDQDTLQTLIETNEILRIALSRYQAIKDAHEMERFPNHTNTFNTLAGANYNANSYVGNTNNDYAGLSTSNPASRLERPRRDAENPFSDPDDIPPLSLDRLSVCDDGPGPSKRSAPPTPPPKIETKGGGGHEQGRRRSSEISPVSPTSAQGPAHITYRY